MALPGLDNDQRARAEGRLRDETMLWVTTVRSDGQPQTSPVGFLWDGKRFVILSQPSAQKVANIAGNPRVSLHLELADDAADGGVLTMEGRAVVEEGPVHGEERAAYLARFGEQMDAEGMDRDEALEGFSAVIRVTPTRVRAY